MRLGVNLLYLIPSVVGGTETYARNLLSHLTPLLSSKDQLILFCSRDNASLFTPLPHAQIVTLPLKSVNRGARLLGEQLLLPIYCYHHRIDVLLSLGYSQPYFLPCRTVTTIHDLNWHYCPEDFDPLSRLVIKLVNQISFLRATALICVSQSTADSLSELYPALTPKITVIYHGAPILPATPTKSSPYPQPYLFSLLSHYPHKNLKTLLAAYRQLLISFPDLHLVLGGTGNPTAQSSRTHELSHLPQTHLHLLSFVDQSTLAQIYSHASAFVFPSLYEGFGLPVLEAMAYGVPIVSSNAASLPEIVGRGGILVSPLDVTAYVNSITRLLSKPALRTKLIQAGHLRARDFSWEKCAKQTYNLIKKIYAKAS